MKVPQFTHHECRQIDVPGGLLEEDFPTMMARLGFSDSPGFVLGDAEQDCHLEFFAPLSRNRDPEDRLEYVAMLLVGGEWFLHRGITLPIYLHPLEEAAGGLAVGFDRLGAVVAADVD